MISLLFNTPLKTILAIIIFSLIVSPYLTLLIADSFCTQNEENKVKDTDTFKDRWETCYKSKQTIWIFIIVFVSIALLIGAIITWLMGMSFWWEKRKPMGKQMNTEQTRIAFVNDAYNDWHKKQQQRIHQESDEKWLEANTNNKLKFQQDDDDFFQLNDMVYGKTR
jgi:sterol desaturase/sphingolipid hydroxylase (fatty acid hydroxylase superfamily)